MTNENVMTGSGGQHYIGAPNAVVVCIDGRQAPDASGKFYHAYSRAATPFVNFEQLVYLMEQLFDELQFPYAATNDRSFWRKPLTFAMRKERPQVMKDEELLKKHGDLGTYIIRVQQRQNSSWQGRITWVEKNKTVNFRSVWEMVKLVDESLDAAGSEDPQAELVWEE